MLETWSMKLTFSLIATVDLANLENRTKKNHNFRIITLSKGIIFPKMLTFYEVRLASAKLKKFWY